jgi:hypothetical protein
MSSITYEIFKRDFTLIDIIGSGSYSKVSLIKHNQTNNFFALK